MRRPYKKRMKDIVALAGGPSQVSGRIIRKGEGEMKTILALLNYCKFER